MKMLNAHDGSCLTLAGNAPGSTIDLMLARERVALCTCPPQGSAAACIVSARVRQIGAPSFDTLPRPRRSGGQHQRLRVLMAPRLQRLALDLLASR